MTSYRLIIHLFLPLIVIYTARIAVRYRSMKYFLQRLGFGYTGLDRHSIWLHCASVGEVNTALPLIKTLIKEYPQQAFIVTTVTPTGAEIIGRQKLNNVVHGYLPVDFRFCVNQFLKQVKPKLAFILETEIWPELYFQCARYSIPVTIVNGRLSKKTLQANNWMQKQYQAALGRVDHVMARSETDRSGFLQLGCENNKIEVLGNLKFSGSADLMPGELQDFSQRKFVLLASSHNDEELQFAEMWKMLDVKDYLLVIVPRHPERGRGIAAHLAELGFQVALRSNKDDVTGNTDIYIADTLGELVDFMARADIVFMGGSLIEHGGQNILEPARLAKPLVIGPYFYNFQQEVDLFLEHKACIQVENINQLAETLGRLLQDEQERKDLSARAERLMAEQDDIVEKYNARIKTCYKDYFKS
ncbi:MAG: 3-deoxy-D-manno-octulosonic acid transferase [Gammaproteobacteria bacterium]|nr:3-deoxy-D-manno-octulosonic acid transferase [Gammaproteobacteria bacterium]